MGKVGHSCNDGLRNTHPIPHTVNNRNCRFGNDHTSMEPAAVKAEHNSGETNVKQDNAILIHLDSSIGEIIGYQSNNTAS